MSGNSGLGQCTHSQYVRDFVFLSGKCYYNFLCLWLSFFQENVIIFVFVFAFVFLSGKCYHLCLCCRHATNFVFLSGKCYFSILRTNPRRSRGFIPCKSFVFCREIQIFVLCKSFVFSQRNTTLSIISDAAVIYEELAGGEIEKWKS